MVAKAKAKKGKDKEFMARLRDHRGFGLQIFQVGRKMSYLYNYRIC